MLWQNWRINWQCCRLFHVKLVGFVKGLLLRSFYNALSVYVVNHGLGVCRIVLFKSGHPTDAPLWHCDWSGSCEGQFWHCPHHPWCCQVRCCTIGYLSVIWITVTDCDRQCTPAPLWQLSLTWITVSTCDRQCTPAPLRYISVTCLRFWQTIHYTG